MRMLKWPLIVAAIVVVGRVLAEQGGLPDSVNNLLSAVALHALIVPVYFAIRIAASGMQRPYVEQFKLTGVYVVLVRAMLIPTYWLARFLQWPQPRFSGLAGPDVSPFMGYIALPFGTAAFWITSSLIVGGILGSVIIAVMRLFLRPSNAAS
jgi:hypothetical protein